MEVYKNKSKELADFLAKIAPSGKDPRLGYCAICGKLVDPNSFRDEISRREYEISGICQECQDKIFGK